MKFNRRLQSMMVPEWSDKYINYKLLKSKIKETKADALKIARAYAEVQAVTGEHIKKTIRLQDLKGEVEFFELIEDNIQKVSEFYCAREAEMLKQFHGLIAQAISLGLIEEYTPLKKGLKSRLERELARISTPLEITLDVENNNNKAPTREASKEVIPLRRIVRKSITEEQIQDDERYKANLEKGLSAIFTKILRKNRSTMSMNGRENGTTVKEKPDFKAVEISELYDIESNKQERERSSSSDDEEKVDSSESSSTTNNNNNNNNISNNNNNNNVKTVNNVKNKKKKHERSLDIEIEDQTIKVAQRVQSKPSARKKSLKHAFAEFYRGLILLQSFCTVNSEAMHKILKKHDKNLGLGTREYYIRTQIAPMKWYKHSKLKLMITEIETVFSQAFTQGHRTKAMDKLRVPREQKSVAKSNFWLGINLGLFLPLVALMFYVGFTSSGSEAFPRLKSVIIAYRMVGMAILMMWFWGLDMYLWNRYHVNYVFIFDFNPRQHVRFQHMLEAASVFTIFWGISLFIYMISSVQPKGFGWFDIPWQVHPLVLLAVSGICFVLYQIKSKWWLVRTIARIISAPFVAVKFRDFFIADQLASIVIVLYDLEYTICFFSSDAWTGNDFCFSINPYTRPIIGVLPSLWRLLQSLRRYRDGPDRSHLLNAGKYASAFPVVIFSSLRGLNGSTVWLVLWLVSVIISTCYTFSWDFLRDWSLQPNRKKFPRERILYPKAYYYIAVVTNLLLRFTWALTISPDSIGLILDPTILTAILAGLEILRRAQWNLYRLENEQLNNIGKYRAINVHVPLPDSLISEFADEAKK